MQQDGDSKVSLIIDLDGVVCDFVSMFLAHGWHQLAERGLLGSVLDKGMRPRDMESYSFQGTILEDPNFYRLAWNSLPSYKWAEIKPYPGAVEVLRAWQEIPQLDVLYLTTRPARAATLKWLAKYKLYNNLHTVTEAEEKGVVIEECCDTHEHTILIEDRLDTIESVSDLGAAGRLRAIWVKQPWSRGMQPERLGELLLYCYPTLPVWAGGFGSVNDTAQRLFNNYLLTF